MITKAREVKKEKTKSLPASFFSLMERTENEALGQARTRAADYGKQETAYIAEVARMKGQREYYEAEAAKLEETAKANEPVLKEKVTNLYTQLMRHKSIASVQGGKDSDVLIVETKPLFADIREKEGSRKLIRACLGQFTMKFFLKKRTVKLRNNIFSQHWAIRGENDPCLGEWKYDVHNAFSSKDYYALVTGMIPYLQGASDDGAAYERSHQWRDRRTFSVIQEKTKGEISTGDYVIAVEAEIDGKSLKGLVGKVIQGSGGYVTVEFRDEMGGHNGDTLGEQGHCWSMGSSVLMKIPKALYDKQTKYRLGEINGTEKALEEIDALEDDCTVEEIEQIARDSYQKALRIEA